MPMRIAVCVSGRGSNLMALADALAGSERAELALVLGHRGDVPALARAAARGIPAEGLTDWANGAEWLERLGRARIDLIVLAGYLKLVPPEVIQAYRNRIINIHPALLPDFGGAGMYGRRVHEAVLRSGTGQSGATVHLVDEVYDRGAILAQARVPVLPDDTPERLAERVLAAEHQLLPAVVLKAAEVGRAVPLSGPLPRSA